MKKPILITGGTGYVGSRVAAQFAEEGYSVVVIDKVPPEERGIAFHQNIEFRHVDLRDVEKTRAAVFGCGAVLHLASNIGPLTYMHDHQAEIIAENSAIDASLFPALVEVGADIVVYSSSSMAFQKARRYPYVEEDIADTPPPSNIYGFSKLAGEYFCRAHYEECGLPYVIMRYHNIYGPGEDSKGSSPGDIHVIPALIEKVLSGQYPLVLLGGKGATRPFTYVDDAVDATVMLVKAAVAKDERVMNTDFNIGPGEATKIVDLAELVWSLLGDGRPFQHEIQSTRADTSVRRELDPAKIYALGWKEKVSLEKGILQTAEWIRERKK
jgi:UDP-glucose 4-epimerase